MELEARAAALGGLGGGLAAVLRTDFGSAFPSLRMAPGGHMKRWRHHVGSALPEP